MRRSFVLISGVCLCLACGPRQIGSGSDGATTTATSSDDKSDTEAGASTDSSGGQADTETSDESDTDEEPDDCPATPELLDYVSTLDGSGDAVLFLGGDGSLDWVHSCEVGSDVGTLAAGEIIELDCTDSEGQPVGHTLELLVDVEGAPNKAAVSQGQKVELSMWVTVWHSGTFAWVLRDADQRMLLAHYGSPLLPGPNEADAPAPEFFTPVTVAVDEEVCPLVCPPDGSPGSFVPSGGCCMKDTALVFDHGDGPVQILHRSAGAIPGDVGLYAVVAISNYTDLSTCEVSDANDEYYRFSIFAK